MPRISVYNPSEEHVLCYGCDTWKPVKTIVTHWTRAKHESTHGQLDTAQLGQPRPLFDAAKIPEAVTRTVRGMVIENSAEQPPSEDESSHSVRNDEVYPGAGIPSR
jgi:hypothetical protein